MGDTLQPDWSQGIANQSPDFWKNLANFGANLSVANNQRGSFGQAMPFGAALGAATLANQQYQTQAPLAAQQLQGAKLENTAKGLDIFKSAAELPYLQALTQARVGALQGATGTPNGAPAGTGTPSGAPNGTGTPIPWETATAALESGGGDPNKIDPTSINRYGFAGKYQLGTGDLASAGIYQKGPNEDLTKNQWGGMITIAPYKPMTVQDFLKNPQAQDAAMAHVRQFYEHQIPQLGLDQYEGKNVGGIPITHEALLSGMHIAGPTGMLQFLQSGGQKDHPDGNGVMIPQRIKATNALMMGGAQSGQGAGAQGTTPSGGVVDPVAQAKADALYARAHQLKLAGMDATAEIAQADQYQKAALAGPMASATANAEAAASRHRLITTRTGVYDPDTNQEVYRSPEPEKFLDPKTGMQFPGFITPNEKTGGINIIGGPPGLKPGEVPPTQLSDAQVALRRGEAEDFTKEGATHFAGAYASNQQLDQLDDAIQRMNSTGGWSKTGPGNEFRMKWANSINDAFNVLGVKPPFDPETVGSWVEANKITTHLALEQSRMYEGAHPALGGIKISQAAIPGANTPEIGYYLTSNVIRANNNREIALRNFETKIANDPQSGGNLVGADAKFNQLYPPEKWANWAQSQVVPIKINTPGAVQNLLPGTHFIYPGWKPGMPPKVVPGDINAVGQ